MLAAGQPVLSIWAPIAYLWQDILTVLVFYGIDAAIGAPIVSWILWAAIVAYTALNVPIAATLSSPLTWTIVRAARGPLADSIGHHVTAANLVRVAVPLAVGAAVLWGLRRRAIEIPRRGLVAAAIVALAGPISVRFVETRGQHRSAIGALVETSVPRLDPIPANADWRSSPLGGAAGEDLSRLRGTAAGRNVLLVVLESTGAKHLGLYGAGRDPTPNLTALSRQAIVFDRAYVVYPESIKGLFATLCSRYPAFDTAPEVYARVPCAALPGILQSAGYQTALFHSGRFGYLGMRSIVDGRGFDRLEDAGAISGVVNSSFGVDEASAVTRILGWIDSIPREDPFFVTYLPIAGHHPYASNAPGPFDGDDDFARYLNAIHEGDDALGRLISGLAGRGLLDRTLVVVFGDHGEAFGEHPGNFAHTLFIHEENVRVPYVIAAPGAMAGPIRVSRTASIIDTAPTILDLLGLPAEAGHQGRSLLQPAARMALFYTDYSIGWLGLVDGCSKLLYEVDSDRSRLFDICADPGESRDRGGEFPDRVAAYRERVKAWAAAQKDSVRRGTSP